MFDRWEGGNFWFELLGVLNSWGLRNLNSTVFSVFPKMSYVLLLGTQYM